MDIDVDALRSSGNELYKKNDFNGAEQIYTKAINGLLCNVTDDGKTNDASNIHAVLYCNRSACRLRLNNGAGALADAQSAIDCSHGTLAKAHFRVGQALVFLNRQFDAAMAYTCGSELEPNNSIFKTHLNQAMSHHINSYYPAIIGPERPIRVTWISPSYGKGVFSTKRFQAGDVVFKETPLVSHAYLENDARETKKPSAVIACALCMRTRLTPAHFKCVPKLTSTQSNKLLQEISEFNVGDGVLCQNGCGMWYCSKLCQNRAWHSFHRPLCSGSCAGSDNPMIRLREICRRTSRIRPLVIARLFSSVLMRLSKNENCNEDTLNAAFLPFKNFVSHEMSFLEDDEIVTLLRQQLLPQKGGSILSKILTLSTFRKLHGALARNAQEVKPFSPLQETISKAEESLNTGRLMRILNLKESDYALFRESVRLADVTVSGSGLFELGNSMNHSCEPNIVAVSCSLDNTMSFVAFRDIERNDELCLSYIDEEQSFYSRQNQLRSEYFFSCQCPKCERRE